MLQRNATLSPSAKMYVIEDSLHVGERRVVRGDRLLQALGARRQARKDGMLHVVSSHELVHGGHVALIPGLLMESADTHALLAELLCASGSQSGRLVRIFNFGEHFSTAQPPSWRLVRPPSPSAHRNSGASP